MSREPSADVTLTSLGLVLADRVDAIVPGWVRRCVAGALDDFERSGGELSPSSGGVDAVLRRADVLGRQAAAEVAEELRALARRDVDQMDTTPLAVVRRAVVVPTAVLLDAGVPPPPRDRFAAARFPDDVYGLTPASLSALDPELAGLGAAWGAAKAAAHRARHGDAGP